MIVEEQARQTGVSVAEASFDHTSLATWLSYLRQPSLSSALRRALFDLSFYHGRSFEAGLLLILCSTAFCFSYPGMTLVFLVPNPYSRLEHLATDVLKHVVI